MAYSNFKYPESSYSYFYLKAGKMPVEQMRNEYQRLQQVVAQRLRRFEKSGDTDTQTYKMGKDLPTSKHVPDDELPWRLNAAHDFLKSELSTVRGMNKYRDQQVEKLKAAGFDSINRKNFDAFTEFMEWARDVGYSKVAVSDRVAELFNEAMKKGMDIETIKDEFTFWMDRLNDLKKLKKHRPGRNDKVAMTDKYRKEISRSRIKNLKKLRKERENELRTKRKK